MDLQQTLAVQGWIVARGLSGAGEAELLQGFCERLVAAGIPLRRALIGSDTLHPIVEARTARWELGAGDAEHSEYARLQTSEEDWLRSPLYALEASRAPSLRRRLTDGYRQGEFPVLDRLRAEGFTDYVAARTAFDDPEPFGQVDSVYSSWATPWQEEYTYRWFDESKKKS